MISPNNAVGVDGGPNHTRGAACQPAAAWQAGMTVGFSLALYYLLLALYYLMPCHTVAADVCFAGSIDILDVFRKPSDLPPHLEDILAAKPAAVWLQSGITNQAFEEKLAKAGIKVVSDRCLMVDHRQAAAST